MEAMNDFRSHGGFARAKTLADDLENFIAGIQTGIDLGAGDLAALCAIAAQTVLERSGLPARTLALLKRANQAEGISDLNRGRLICLIANVARRIVGDQNELKHWLAMADELAERSGHPFLKAQANIEQALNSVWQGDTTTAYQQLTEAREQARAAGIHHSESLALRCLGTVTRNAGNVTESLDFLEQARAIARANGDDMASVQIHSVSAGIFRLLGNTDEAGSCYMVALTLSRQMKLRSIEGIVTGNIANLYTQLGQLDKAKQRYELALQIAAEVGNVRSEAICQGNLGGLLSTMGELDRGARLLTRAIETQDHIHPGSAGSFRGALALIRAKQGDIEEARGLLEVGEQQLRGVDQEELGLLLCSRGEVEFLAGEMVRVEQALKEAEEICVQLNVRPESQLGQATEQLRRTRAERDAAEDL